MKAAWFSCSCCVYLRHAVHDTNQWLFSWAVKSVRSWGEKKRCLVAWSRGLRNRLFVCAIVVNRQGAGEKQSAYSLLRISFPTVCEPWCWVPSPNYLLYIFLPRERWRLVDVIPVHIVLSHVLSQQFGFLMLKIAWEEFLQNVISLTLRLFIDVSELHHFKLTTHPKNSNMS